MWNLAVDFTHYIAMNEIRATKSAVFLEQTGQALELEIHKFFYAVNGVY